MILCLRKSVSIWVDIRYIPISYEKNIISKKKRIELWNLHYGLSHHNQILAEMLAVQRESDPDSLSPFSCFNAIFLQPRQLQSWMHDSNELCACALSPWPQCAATNYLSPCRHNTSFLLHEMSSGICIVPTSWVIFFITMRCESVASLFFCPC